MPNQRGCNEAAAREYLGCSQTMFDELKSRRIVLPLRKGWYSYRLLDVAMDHLEAEIMQASAILTKRSDPTNVNLHKAKQSMPKRSGQEILATIKANERKSA